MNYLLMGVGVALGIALWPIVLPVLILILIAGTFSSASQSHVSHSSSAPPRAPRPCSCNDARCTCDS